MIRTTLEGTTMAPAPTSLPALDQDLVGASRGDGQAAAARWVIDPRHPHIDPHHDDHLLVEDERAAVAALLWAAADAVDADDRSLLRMQLGLGLQTAEIAGVLGTTPDAAERRLFQMRRRLARAVPARLLWDAGEGGCRRLQVALRAAGIGRFGPEAVRAIAVHVVVCDRCARAEDQLRGQVA